MRKITRFAQSMEEETQEPIVEQPVEPEVEEKQPEVDPEKEAMEKAREIAQNPQFVQSLKEKVKDEMPKLFEQIFTGGNVNAGDVLGDKKQSAQIAQSSPEFKRLLEETAKEVGTQFVKTASSNKRQVKLGMLGMVLKMLLFHFLPSILGGLGKLFGMLLLGGVAAWGVGKITDWVKGADPKIGDSNTEEGKKAKDWGILDSIKSGIKTTGDGLGLAWDVITGDWKEVRENPLVPEIAKKILTNNSHKQLKTASKEKLEAHVLEWLREKRVQLGLSDDIYVDLTNSKDLPEMIKKIESHQAKLEQDLKPALKGAKIEDIEFDKLYSAVPKMNIQDLRTANLKNPKTAAKVKNIMRKL